MNQNKSIIKGRQGAKRRKLNGQSNENEIQSSYIFKLPVEIFEYILDYLPLQNLNTVSETCKYMKRIVAEFYRRHFSGLCPIFCEEQKMINQKILFNCVDIRMNDFIIGVVEKITICNSDHFKSFCSRNWKLDQLRKLILSYFSLPYVKVRLKGVQKLLCNLEYLHIYSMEDELYESHLENFLSLTPNIKRLYLEGTVFENNNRRWKDETIGKKWLMHRYPTLEHCSIEYGPQTSYSTYVLPIATFLELNPNIHSFGIDSLILWKNRDSIKVAQIKLDNLMIFISNELIYMKEIEKFQSLCHLLNELHCLGLYKRLTMYSSCVLEPFDQELIDEMAKLNALNDLRIYTYKCNHITLANLEQLEEISISESSIIKDLESTTNSLKHLERIHFGRSNLNHLMLFISKTSKLKQMKVDWFLNMDDNMELHQIINLSALNKERAKLLNATKVTLYVEERVYLATKRAKRELDLDLIKLKRLESHDWDYDVHFRWPNDKKSDGNKILRWLPTGEKTYSRPIL